MATWFNLPIINDLVSENAKVRTDELVLTKAALFNSEGRRLTALFSAVSRQRALDHIAKLGMRTFDPPRLLVYIKEPFTEGEFIPIFGPLETEDVWVHAAIARLRVSGKL